MINSSVERRKQGFMYKYVHATPSSRLIFINIDHRDCSVMRFLFASSWPFLAPSALDVSFSEASRDFPSSVVLRNDN